MCVKFLLEFHASPLIMDKDGFSPLHEAANIGALDIVNLLLSFDADPLQIKENKNVVKKKEFQYWTPIHISVERNYPDVLKVLLENSSDPSIPNNSSVTPLHLAASQKNRELLNILIEHNADIEAKDVDGDPPLFPAVTSRLLQNVEKLTNDQTIIMANKEGKTALHLASYCGFQEIVSFLIQKGSNVKTCDKKGNSPLHYAAMKGNLDCVRILVNADADPLLRNKENVSPFALSTGEVLAFLRTYVDQKREVLRAEPVEKGEISTRASPSRLKSRASTVRQSPVQSPSRRTLRGTPEKVQSPTKNDARRKETSAVMRTLNPRLAKTVIQQQEMPQTCREYQEKIKEAVQSTSDEIEKQIKELKKLVQYLRDDLEEEENKKKDENK